MSRLLDARGIDHALIGAAALAAHGVARATSDLDLLATDTRCLREAIWNDLLTSGVTVELRPGDESDPLAGVVRVVCEDEAPVDLIVGKPTWQREVVGRATPTRIGDVSVPVVGAADLVLLKLYAGGPQDAWDIDQLLDVNASIAAEVEARLGALPVESAELWRRIRSQRGTAT